MEFSKQEYWSGLLFPSPGDLPDLGIKARYPAMQVDSLLSELPGSPVYTYHIYVCIAELLTQYCKSKILQLKKRGDSGEATWSILTYWGAEAAHRSHAGHKKGLPGEVFLIPFESL